jgi:hypothetical protein
MRALLSPFRSTSKWRLPSPLDVGAFSRAIRRRWPCRKHAKPAEHVCLQQRVGTARGVSLPLLGNVAPAEILRDQRCEHQY